jgi:hypothetical protein
MALNGNRWKRFVAKPNTSELLRADGAWTTDDGEAMEFDCLGSMIRTCLKFHVQEAQILLRLRDARSLDVRFPLRPRTDSVPPKHSI